MLNEYPTKLARIGAVLALVSALVWVQWPINFDRFGYASSIALIGAIVTWISIEVADWQNHYGYNINILNEDAEKMNELIEIVDRKTYYILRNANVETYIGIDDYRGIEDLVAHFEEDPFPFHNGELQRMYENFEKRSREFLRNLWGLYTSDGQGRATWRPRGDRWVDENRYQRVMSQIADLNRTASGLAEAWEEFIRFSKTELRGNSIGIASYKSRK